MKVVSCLKREIPSSCSGTFSYCVKIVSFKSPFMDDLRQRNMALEFWIAREFVRLVRAVSMLAFVMEW